MTIKDVYIETESFEIRQFLLNLAHSHAVPLGATTERGMNTEVAYEEFPVICWHPSNNHLSGWSSYTGLGPSRCEKVGINKFIRLIKEYTVPEEVELNSKTTAIFIPGKEVRVGCQTFSAEAIEEFIEKYIQ